MSYSTYLMLNQQGLEDHQEIPTVCMGFHTNNSSFSLSNWTFPSNGYPQSLLRTNYQTDHAPFSELSDQAASLLLSTTPKHIDVNISSNIGSQFEAPSSVPRSTTYLWPWGEVDDDGYMGSKQQRSSIGENNNNNGHLGFGAIKMMKKVNGRRKIREPRFCFKTMSDVDVMDDGYKWRKYGQKVVKNTQHPRSYYRCTVDSCRVKKRVERLAEDPRMVITTYEGRHAHSPSHDQESFQSDLQTNNFFW